MSSTPITARQIDGEKVEVVTDFLFLGSKITLNGDCSHEIKRQLLLGRKAMTKLECVKSKDITLQTKNPIVEAMVFLIVMYGGESWTPLLGIYTKEMILVSQRDNHTPMLIAALFTLAKIQNQPKCPLEIMKM